MPTPPQEYNYDYARYLIAKEKEERTGFLDIGNCGLTELPPEIGDLFGWRG